MKKPVFFLGLYKFHRNGTPCTKSRKRDGIYYHRGFYTNERKGRGDRASRFPGTRLADLEVVTGAPLFTNVQDSLTTSRGLCFSPSLTSSRHGSSSSWISPSTTAAESKPAQQNSGQSQDLEGLLLLPRISSHRQTSSTVHIHDFATSCKASPLLYVWAAALLCKLAQLTWLNDSLKTYEILFLPCYLCTGEWCTTCHIKRKDSIDLTQCSALQGPNKIFSRFFFERERNNWAS